MRDVYEIYEVKRRYGIEPRGRRGCAEVRIASGAPEKQLHKNPSGSFKVTPEERAAMTALAELLREIYLRRQQEAVKDHRSTLTGNGKLLVQ